MVKATKNGQNNIDSGYGLVPSSNKPYHEAMLTQIHDAIWLR